MRGRQHRAILDLIDLATGAIRRIVLPGTDRDALDIVAVAVSDDGGKVAAIVGSAGSRHALVIDTRSGQVTTAPPGSEDQSPTASVLAFDHGGGRLAVAAPDAPSSCSRRPGDRTAGVRSPFMPASDR